MRWREAGKTRFDLQTLGGVRQYLNGYLQTRERATLQQGRRPTARQSEQRQTQLRLDYDQYRRAEAQRLFDSLPADEQADDRGPGARKIERWGPGLWLHGPNPYYGWKSFASPSSGIPAVLPTSTSGQRPAQLKSPNFLACALTERVCGLDRKGCVV